MTRRRTVEGLRHAAAAAAFIMVALFGSPMADAWRCHGSVARRHGVHMRVTPSSEEKERGIQLKELRNKQSQVLLAQRVAHIRRLRQQRRAEVAESWQPATPNARWRDAASGERQNADAPLREGRLRPGLGGDDVGLACGRGLYAGTAMSTVVSRSWRKLEYLPLSAWRSLRMSPEGAHTCFQEMRGSSPFVVVLAEPSLSTNDLVEGLRRMRIIPPEFASVVGVTSLDPEAAGRLAKKHQLTFPLLSDEDRQWMTAHKMPVRSLDRAMFIMDAQGMLLAQYKEVAAGAVNDCVIETLGDWRRRKDQNSHDDYI